MFLLSVWQIQYAKIVFRKCFKQRIIRKLMIKFNCRACGYSTEKNEKPLKCPYCGKMNSMSKEETASELIEEA